MARLLTNGAEEGNTTFWNVATGLAANSSVKRSGVYSHALLLGSSCNRNLSSAISEGYVRFGYYASSLGGGAIIHALRSDTNNVITITITAATKKFTVNYATGSFVSNTVFELSTWYLIELHFKIANSGGVIELNVDGVLDNSYSGDTLATYSNINNVYFQNGAQVALYVDDIALNDISGAVDISWCGDGKIIAIAPVSDYGTSEFVGSDGNSVNNYDMVEEVPPNDADYVRALAAGEIDRYNLAASSVDLSSAEIKRVWVAARAKSDTSPDVINIGLRTYDTDYTEEKALPSSFGVITGTEQTVNPNTTDPWTDDEIDDLILVLQAPSS
jgi:hypothetical protein